MAIITINGKDIEVFDPHIDAKPLISSDPDALRRFNEGMRTARRRIVVMFDGVPTFFDVPMQTRGTTQREGEFIPTGPVVDGSVAIEEGNVNRIDCESERRCYEAMLFGKKRGKQ